MEKNKDKKKKKVRKKASFFLVMTITLSWQQTGGKENVYIRMYATLVFTHPLKKACVSKKVQGRLGVWVKVGVGVSWYRSCAVQ